MRVKLATAAALLRGTGPQPPSTDMVARYGLDLAVPMKQEKSDAHLLTHNLSRDGGSMERGGKIAAGTNNRLHGNALDDASTQRSDISSLQRGLTPVTSASSPISSRTKCKDTMPEVPSEYLSPAQAKRNAIHFAHAKVKDGTLSSIEGTVDFANRLMAVFVKTPIAVLKMWINEPRKNELRDCRSQAESKAENPVVSTVVRPVVSPVVSPAVSPVVSPIVSPVVSPVENNLAKSNNANGNNAVGNNAMDNNDMIAAICSPAEPCMQQQPRRRRRGCRGRRGRGVPSSARESSFEMRGRLVQDAGCRRRRRNRRGRRGGRKRRAARQQSVTGGNDSHVLGTLAHDSHESTLDDKQYAMITRLLDFVAHFEAIPVSYLLTSRRLTSGVQEALVHNPLRRVAPSLRLSRWEVSCTLDCVGKLYAIDDDAWRRIPEFVKIWNDPSVLAKRFEWLEYLLRADVSARHKHDLQECRAERSQQLKAQRLAAMARGRAQASARRQAEQEAVDLERRHRKQRAERAKAKELERAVAKETYFRHIAEQAVNAASAIPM